MAMKTSSKHDHITCKDLIQPGSPNVYRLKPKKENIGTLTRMTLGEKDPRKKTKTILFVGETGAGKSTLINALVNYTMGVKWEDDVWFQIVDDEEKSQCESQTSDVTDFEGEEKSQCESQTTDVIVYEIFGFEGQTLPYSLTIIDTPGYGDTRGTEHDVIVSQRLLDLFRSDDGVHEISAVGLVMKASDNRLSDRLRYIYDSLVSLFGKNMEENIVALITHSDGRTPENVLKAIETAEIRCAKNEKNQPVHFLFNNCQHEDRTEDTEALQQADKRTMKGLSQFTNFLEKTESQKLKETVKVLNERVRLTACIHNLQERNEFLELKQSAIKQNQEALKKYEEEMKNNEEFTVEVKEVYKVKVAVSEWRVWALGLNYGGAVCCTVCKETCHYPCTLAWYPEDCEVMKEKCTLCKDKCFVADHEKGKPCTECEGKCCVSFHVKGKQCPLCEDKYRESDHEKKLYCTVCTGKCPVSAHVKDKQCTVCVDDCCVSGHEEGKECPVCEGKTKKSDHVKKMWKYVSTTRKVQMTKQDMKEKFEKGKAGCEESTNLLETLQQNMEELERDKDQRLEEAFQHVETLEQLALNVKSLSTFVHLDFLIEKMKEKGDTEKVKKLEKMKVEMDKNEGIKAALRKISSKHDHITCKALIRPGSPNVYRLKPKKENIGTLTRMTLGEKDPSKKTKTILLVGETGAGKSALVNALVNYTMGVKWEDDVWFQIVEDEEKSQCESQTTDVIVYEIFGFEGQTLPYSLTIIDTPGYGDTRGTEHDVIVSQRLLDLFCSDDGVHEISAVGLVMKASDNRLSDRLRYIFDSVVSLFGKNLEKNFVALITHSNGVTPENVFKALEAANIKCAKDEENEPVHFLFDNHQSTQKTKKNNVALKNAWSLTEDQMDQFTDFLQNTSSQDLTATVEVLNRRIRLTASIHNLQERVEFIELKQREIKQNQEALKRYEEEMKNNEEFTVEVEEVYKVKVAVSEWRVWALGLNYGGAVCCTVCKENCHFPCTLAWYPEHCEVMEKKCTVCEGKCSAWKVLWSWAHEKKINCTVCTGKCPASAHVKETWRYESKTRKVPKTKQDMKEKFEKGKAGREESTNLLETLQKNMEELERDKDQWLEEAFQCVVTLEQLALNVKSLSTFVHLDFLIEKMKEKGDTEKVKKLEEMKVEMDKNEGIKAALSYVFGRVTAAGRAAKKRMSSKHDHITCKALIRPGSPNVYRLKPKKENIGTLTRMTLGEKDPSKKNKTILLVGETGAGKSALINALVNYTMGVKWEDDVWFQIVDDEEKSQCESQTTDVIVYEIFGFEGQTLPYSLTIIDTPGYGDTRGTEHDAIVSQRLFDLFRSDDGVHEISAVGLVMKASDNRLSDRLRYIFDSLVSLFGKNMEENIVALITHSNGVTPENVFKALEAANIKCAKDEENEPVHFMFDNHQSTQKTKKNNVALKNAWSLTEDQIDQFTDFLQNTSSQDLTATVEVLNRRIRLTACIHNLQERIEFIELKQSEIKQTQEALKKHEEEMKNNEEFTVEDDEVYKVKVPIEGGGWSGWWFKSLKGAVCCTVCEENCHYPCTVAGSLEYCKVMEEICTVCKGKCSAWPWAHEKKINCTVCTGKCPASVHVKKMWKYVSKTRKVQKTKQDMKEKFEKGKAGYEESTNLLETLQKNIEELEKDKDQWLEEAFQHVTLEQFALNVKSLSTFVHLDFLIEKMKEKGDTKKVKKLEKMKAEMDKNEGIKAALSYAFGRVTAAVKAAKK